MAVHQRGLRRRVEIESRRIPAQHRQLDQLYGALIDALEHRGAQAAAAAAFRRFQDACRAHFAMEDEVYFPALHGLRPELDADLAALVEEHRALTATLEELEALFEAGRLAEAEEGLDRLVPRLAAHEGREERLLDGLRGGGEGRGAPSERPERSEGEP